MLQESTEKAMLPWFDKLTMRINPLKALDLILSLSKDESRITSFFQQPPGNGYSARRT
jgi:hypothetical protein